MHQSCPLFQNGADLFGITCWIPPLPLSLRSNKDLLLTPPSPSPFAVRRERWKEEIWQLSFGGREREGWLEWREQKYGPLRPLLPLLRTVSVCALLLLRTVCVRSREARPPCKQAAHAMPGQARLVSLSIVRYPILFSAFTLKSKSFYVFNNYVRAWFFSLGNCMKSLSSKNTTWTWGLGAGQLFRP